MLAFRAIKQTNGRMKSAAQAATGEGQTESGAEQTETGAGGTE